MTTTAMAAAAPKERASAWDISSTMSEDRLTWHLENWAQWMSRDHVRGYSSRASSGLGSTSSREFDAMCAEQDTKCAVAVGAIIDGLTSEQDDAVHTMHLGRAYPEKCSVPLANAYAAARIAIRRGLTRRGIL